MNEKDIDKEVFAYQEGEPGAAETLLSLFGGDTGEEKYLGKYIRLLKDEVYDLQDKDTRRFLQLYMKEGGPGLHYHWQGKEARSEAARVAGRLSYVMEMTDREELVVDLQILFLQQVKRYRKTKKAVDFRGYLYNSFRYAVYNHLKRTVFKTDVLNLRDRDVYDDEIHGEGGIELEEEWFYPEGYFDDGELGLDWVNGRCNMAFEELRPLERLILRMHYEDGKTDTEIAEHLGFHRNTVLRHRHRAKERLCETLDALKELDVYL